MVEIYTTTKWKPSIEDARLSSIGNSILGKKYNLTIIFTGKQKIQTLNKKYRNKTYTPNVLSFPISKDMGEIYICPEIAKKEAPDHGFSVDDYIQYLVIHGSTHLLGLDHGKKMDTLEKKFIKKFKLSQKIL